MSIDGSEQGKSYLVSIEKPAIENRQFLNGQPTIFQARGARDAIAEETIGFGRELAAYLQPPCLVLLEGDLGAGKTTLVKGIVAGLGAASEDELTSPSFTLVHEYGSTGRVYHADLYRMEESRATWPLWAGRIIEQATTVLVEWGEKLGDDAPVPCVKIRMEHLGSDDRQILVERVEA